MGITLTKKKRPDPHYAVKMGSNRQFFQNDVNAVITT
jgi:hypothetical protein